MVHARSAGIAVPTVVAAASSMAAATRADTLTEQALARFARNDYRSAIAVLRQALGEVPAAMRAFVPEDVLPVAENLRRSIEALERP